MRGFEFYYTCCNVILFNFAKGSFLLHKWAFYFIIIVMAGLERLREFSICKYLKHFVNLNKNTCKFCACFITFLKFTSKKITDDRLQVNNDHMPDLLSSLYLSITSTSVCIEWESKRKKNSFKIMSAHCNRETNLFLMFLNFFGFPQFVFYMQYSRKTKKRDTKWHKSVDNLLFFLNFVSFSLNLSIMFLLHFQSGYRNAREIGIWDEKKTWEGKKI